MSWQKFAGFENEFILVESLKRGKAVAVEFWYKKYFQRLKRVALMKLPSEMVAQEIVQDTFIHCLQSLNLFQNTSSLLTWMQAVLRHEIADFYRKRYAKKFIQTLPLTDMLLDKNHGDAEETAEKVKMVLKQMLGGNKELLMSKYVDRKAVKEIALERGKTAKAVESELFRARQEFRRLWEALEQEERGFSFAAGEK
jgi:RNA polymerase sigma-70 factor (ECF subfamily)